MYYVGLMQDACAQAAKITGSSEHLLRVVKFAQAGSKVASKYVSGPWLSIALVAGEFYRYGAAFVRVPKGTDLLVNPKPIKFDREGTKSDCLNWLGFALRVAPIPLILFNGIPALSAIRSRLMDRHLALGEHLQTFHGLLVSIS